MAKMWAGRTDGITDSAADDFNSSIRFDSRMYRQDIEGSKAHAAMLRRCGIITEDEAEILICGLDGILSDIESADLKIDMQSEDIHMFIEAELTARVGETGKKLHTARSRNDQVALDTRMYLRENVSEITDKLHSLISALADKAERYKDAIMPGYTHLQRAQPITFGHHLCAYCMMLMRDIDRLSDCKKRMNVSPIGSCALAGTTYDTDRQFEARLLGFDGVCHNSMDGVSDRDFVIELASVLSIIMMHLSRLAEEIIMWSSWEFKFIELSDAFTTGSSIMPQKKNPDMAELVRGKTGRVYGNLMALLTTLKGLPLAYNKDMQEDKEGIFDSCDTVKACADIFTGMISSMMANTDNMLSAAKRGFINATDLADYLVKKGMPFRSAYKVSGSIVRYCMEKGKTLEDLTLAEYKEFSEQIEQDVYSQISLETCVKKRISYGGTSVESVINQLEHIKKGL